MNRVERLSDRAQPHDRENVAALPLRMYDVTFTDGHHEHICANSVDVSTGHAVFLDRLGDGSWEYIRVVAQGEFKDILNENAVMTEERH